MAEPKRMGLRADQPVCERCRETIHPRDLYHYIKPKRARMLYYHAKCWTKEMLKNEHGD